MLFRCLKWRKPPQLSYNLNILKSGFHNFYVVKNYAWLLKFKSLFGHFLNKPCRITEEMYLLTGSQGCCLKPLFRKRDATSRDSGSFAAIKGIFQTDACCLPFNENISACAFILWTGRRHLWSQLPWEAAEHLPMPQSHTLMSWTCASNCSSYSRYLNKVAQLSRLVYFVIAVFL